MAVTCCIGFVERHQIEQGDWSDIAAQQVHQDQATFHATSKLIGAKPLRIMDTRISNEGKRSWSLIFVSHRGFLDFPDYKFINQFKMISLF